MTPIAVVLLLGLLALAVWVVSAPLRGPRRGTGPDPRLAALEAAKEAKYAEIRDAEMDFRTGKLSAADYKTLERALRAEAVEILHDLDRLA